ncbi:hypothetical protein NM688_g1954 [Phlebia brevispora]|uniref:Uncharacterized protein n=1 Tax=Phlebia brevispora TaxID=194682 RepID=A0ACC1T9N3_9APHY|nr:hypothetical protein NM688_g1954 [Phlebia brevispora]
MFLDLRDSESEQAPQLDPSREKCLDSSSSKTSQLCRPSPYKLGDVVATKRELGKIALVCRQWSRKIQPKIFERIELRHYKDVQTFRSFLACPNSRVAGYIRHITISSSLCEYPQQPWIHSVCIYILPKLKNVNKDVPLTVTGPLPGRKCMKTIHGLLPRWAPSFSYPIRRLSLFDVRLRQSRDLFRLLKEVPCLEELTCKRVTWDVSPNEAGEPIPFQTSCLPISIRNTSGVIRYTMVDCTDCRIAAWLSVLIAPSRTNRITREDACTACLIANAFMKNGYNPSRSSTTAAGLSPDPSDGGYEENAVRAVRWTDEIWFMTEQLGSTQVVMPHVAVYLTPSVIGQQRRIRAISIAIQEDIPEASLTRWNWAAVDANAARLLALEVVLLVFHSGEDLQRFNKNVAVSMPYLWESHKLNYALSTDSGWVRMECRGASPAYRLDTNILALVIYFRRIQICMVTISSRSWANTD